MIYTCSIISNDSYEAKDLVIPEFVSDGTKLYKVIMIGYQAFESSNDIKGSITFGNSIKYIGTSAFNECAKITSLNLSNVGDIDAHAFKQCTGLTSIKFSDSIYKISNGAFYGCTNLAGKITIPGSVDTISHNVFYGCEKITSIELKEGIEKINDGAFYGCTNLTGTLTIPDSISEIGINAFSYCEKITSVAIGSGCQSIGSEAFLNCTLLSYFQFKGTLQNIGRDAFLNCTALIGTYSDGYINYKISCNNDNVYYLKNGSDYYCIGSQDNVIDTMPAITPVSDTINIISGTKTICYGAFLYCINIANVTLNDDLNFINGRSFCYCESLANIAIPNSVKIIGDLAFYNCSTIQSVIFGNDPHLEKIDSSAFSRSGLTTFSVPNTVKIININAFAYCSSINSISFGNSPQLEEIGQEAFYNCTALTGDLNINSTVTQIGSRAFRDTIFTTITLTGFNNDFVYDE
jgi:hypothetical protein